MSADVLDVSDLVVRNADVSAVRGVSLRIGAGQRVGLVGESGAGKSLTALAIMGLLPEGWWAEGSIIHDSADIARLSDRVMSAKRGRTLSMIFQDPLTALNPTKRVGRQITDVIQRHTDADADSAHAQARKLMEQMNLPRQEQILRAYPHQLSGGQRQRIMIAIAVACYPQLIIADEPTTALDVTVQKQVLRLLSAAVDDRGSALLLITHDLPVIAALCDHVAVMYGGRIVEQGPVAAVFRSPRHPYTKGLLESQPTADNIARHADDRLPSIRGSVPPIHALPSGCAFRTRCEFATDQCTALPELDENTQRVACWHPVHDGRSHTAAIATAPKGEL